MKTKKQCEAFWADVRGTFGFTGKGTVGIMSTEHIADAIGLNVEETENWLLECVKHNITERQGGGWVI